MVLSTKDIHLSQREIVERTFGKVIDRPGSLIDVLSNLNGTKKTSRGRFVKLRAYYGEGPPSFETLKEYLDNQTPIIIGITNSDGDTGHAVVVTAVIYELSRSVPRIRRIQVRDPAPFFQAMEGKRTLTPGEFACVSHFVVITADE